ncbi:MAG: helix-turn-helix domain-containing protein [Gemmatimonas sp.]|nr:helix-turn-helix domain-containing protein [Gemmatimonas sp.]
MTPLKEADWVVRRLGDGEPDDKKLQRVYRMARNGVLPSVRLGRKVRFDPEVIERWIAQGGTAIQR